MDNILEAKDLSINFMGLKALSDFNLQLKNKELVGLIGPNGAGKTTVFNILTGVYAQSSGEYILNGENIYNLKPHQLAKKGIARTFQNIRLFKEMTVIDNIIVAMNFNMKYGYLSGAFRLPKYWKEEKEIYEEAMDLLKFFALEDYSDYLAGSLPYGLQRVLEIARALATKPDVLLLDEPAAGMNPHETDNLMLVIKNIRDVFNISVLLIEHDMQLVLGICERVIVLDYGKIIAQGDPYEVVNNPKVIEAYLGTDSIKEEK